MPTLSLHQKALALVGISLTSLIGTLYAASSTVLMNSYHELEGRTVERSVAWVLESYRKQLDILAERSFDWAAWDETYQLVQQLTPATVQTYVQKNLANGLTLRDNLDVLVFLNAQGRVVYGANYQHIHEQHSSAQPLPQGLQSYLQSHPQLLQHATPTQVRRGAIAISEGLLLLVARPIVTTKGTGPIQGTLVMGEFLDSELLAQMANATHLELQAYPLSTAPLQNIPPTILTPLLQGTAVVVQSHSDAEISGYTLIRDFARTPIAVLEVTSPREIHQQGRQNLLYLVTILLIVGLVFGTTTMLLAHRLIQLWREQQESQRQLAWQASHDDLTQLVNRRAFEQQLDRAIATAHNHGQPYGLCYLDLDQFKIINDTCGHQAGDELLRQVTSRLQAYLPTNAVLARLGGDEFGLLLQTDVEAVAQVAEQLRRSLQEFRFRWQDQIFSIGVSIGVVAIDANSPNRAGVLSASDAACYVAKNRGRNRVHVYQPDDQEVVQQYSEMQWVARINQALEEDRFCLYCQAIAPVTSSNSDGEHYEVLVRLHDEAGNIVPPGDFIPAAERYSLMHLIDRWVIRTLFATQATHYRQAWERHQQEGHHCLYAVNLSGASINDDQFIDFIYEQFTLHRIPPQVICFEITETVAITNLNRAIQFMHELKRMGCHFALDDFGSGMSSFGYLKNLPIDYLKIDGEFIKDMMDDPTHRAMTGAINQIGHLMGIRTIAEFVEDRDILVHLKAIGVDYAQGYGIARPQPLEKSVAAAHLTVPSGGGRRSLN